MRTVRQQSQFLFVGINNHVHTFQQNRTEQNFVCTGQDDGKADRRPRFENDSDRSDKFDIDMLVEWETEFVT